MQRTKRKNVVKDKKGLKNNNPNTNVQKIITAKNVATVEENQNFNKVIKNKMMLDKECTTKNQILKRVITPKRYNNHSQKISTISKLTMVFDLFIIMTFMLSI
jgi:maltodextrin utilization protein YvdJ